MKNTNKTVKETHLTRLNLLENGKFLNSTEKEIEISTPCLKRIINHMHVVKSTHRDGKC